VDKFITKIVLNGIIVIPLLMWFAGASFMSAMITAVALAVIAYLLGDQIILRASNNTIATIADAVLAIVFLWMVAYFMNWRINLIQLVTIALVLGVVEAFFHRFLQKAPG
jgi:membrane protein DedA with SNARE-associated domain